MIRIRQKNAGRIRPRNTGFIPHTFGVALVYPLKDWPGIRSSALCQPTQTDKERQGQAIGGRDETETEICPPEIGKFNKTCF